MSRRRFLGLTGGAGLVLAGGLGVPQLFGRPSSTGALLRSRLPLPRPFEVPLPIPRVLEPVSRAAGGDHYELVQREAEMEILPGRKTRIFGYDGTFPGPTIECRQGRQVTVTHRNELPFPVVVHLHGGRTPSASDGYPTDLLLPVGQSSAPRHAMYCDLHAQVRSGTRDYVYPLDQRAATLWYHDHRMDFTGATVYRGLAGFHIIRDDEEDALPLPRGERELPLMITDRAFAADGSFLYPSVDPSLMHTPGVRGPYIAGVLGDVVLVNGAPWPVHEVTATRYRLRLLNASNARRYELALEPPPRGGAVFVQIGTDGGLLGRPQALQTVTIAPAERRDLIVDFGRYRIGSEVTLVNRFGSGSTTNVMRFRIARDAADDTAIPVTLSSTEEPLDPARATVTRDFAFRAGQMDGHAGWVIGGKPFAAGRADATPRLGATEIWRFVADLHHPIHLHLVTFKVLSRGGRAPGPGDAGRKDVVDLAPGEGVEIVTRFDGYRGRYVFHCHNLEHEDMGMMATFRTV